MHIFCVFCVYVVYVGKQRIYKISVLSQRHYCGSTADNGVQQICDQVYHLEHQH